ncbi:MAG: addiction module protein [Polyangiaceae bacterium]|nr:addiction module protein [Polyangiaceae bacterium]
MPYVLPALPAGFDELPVDQQVDYVQLLWDRIAAQGDRVEVPTWHREVLDERLAKLQTDSDSGQPWEEFESELRAELAHRR